MFVVYTNILIKHKMTPLILYIYFFANINLK